MHKMELLVIKIIIRHTVSLPSKLKIHHAINHIYFDLDRSSETDDDAAQEYDARPLSKSKSKPDQISQHQFLVFLGINEKNPLKQQ